MLNFDPKFWAGDKWTGPPVVAQPSLLLLLKGLLLRFIFLYCGGWCYWHLKHFLNFQGFSKVNQVSTENKSSTYSGGGRNLQVQGLKDQVCSWCKLNDFPTVQTKLKKKNNGTLFRHAEAGRDPVASILSWIWHSPSYIYFVYQTQMNRKQRGLLFHVICVRYTKCEKKTPRTVRFNPLSPKSDQHQISPWNINAL